MAAFALQKYFACNVLKQDTPCDITSLKQKARCKIVDLEALVNTFEDVKCLKTITQHIQAAITVGTAIQGMRKTLPEKITSPPNTNSQKQRFYSTKKRKMTSSTTLSKPSYEQSDICKSRLRSMEPLFCAICLQEDDTSMSVSSIVDWVQCSHCQMWVHLTRANFKLADFDKYVCKYCT